MKGTRRDGGATVAKRNSKVVGADKLFSSRSGSLKAAGSGRPIAENASKAVALVLQKAIAGGNLQEARQIVDQMDMAMRSGLLFLIQEARLLMLEGRLPEAEATCRAALKSGPASAGTLVLLCNVLHMQGRGKEARELFMHAIWTIEIPAERKASLLARITNGCRAGELSTYFAQLEAIRPVETAELNRIVAAEARLGLPARAVERLVKAERKGGLSHHQSAQVVALLLRSGNFAEARRRIDLHLQEQPDDPEWAFRKVQFLMMAGENETAVESLAGALAVWPGDYRLLSTLMTLSVKPERFANIFDGIDAARRRTAFEDLALFKFALAALHVRRTGLALEVLAGIAEGPHGLSRNAADLRDALSSKPLEDWTRTARFHDDMTRDIQIVRDADAVATIIAFPGLRNQFGSLPLDLADALFAPHKVNVIYLRDFNQRVFLKVPDHWGGSQLGLAAFLRDRIAELGAAPLITVGTSSGGFPALRLGALLGAGAAISLSGPTRLYAASDRPAQLRRSKGLAEMESYPARERDVLPDVSGCPQMRVWHVAGTENAEDMHQQSRLHGLSNVVLEQLPGTSEHNTVLPMIASGRFDALIAAAIEQVR